MTFVPHTPESLLSRSDSKDPATTCRGITTIGRPCRRALATSLPNSPSSPHGKGYEVVAVATLDAQSAAAFFCWQHKDQAEPLLKKLIHQTQVLPLKGKNSIDTLIDRIGAIHLTDGFAHREAEAKHGERQDEHREPGTHLRQQGRTYANMANETEGKEDLRSRNASGWTLQRQHRSSRMTSHQSNAQPDDDKQRSKPQACAGQHLAHRIGQSNVKASWSCCIRVEPDDLPPPRRREGKDVERRQRRHLQPRDHQYESVSPVGLPAQRPRPPYPAPSSQPFADLYQTNQALLLPTLQTQMPPQTTRTQDPRGSAVQYPQVEQLRFNPTVTPSKLPSTFLSSTSPPHSQTTSLLSLIPPLLSPTTTSALLSELSKPISRADKEGYIYIFWLTPETKDAKPDNETASTLLDYDNYSPTPSPHGPSHQGQRRRQSEINRHETRNKLTAQALHRFASVKQNSSSSRKILLKIGRANNVHRRLSQWTKQCGQNITLIRYYPYRSQHQSQFLNEKTTVPHVHRVERLIHLELADQRVADKGKCEQCGREHKEWFEVDATRDGLRAVDEVVRRWVGWAEGQV